MRLTSCTQWFGAVALALAPVAAHAQAPDSLAVTVQRMVAEQARAQVALLPGFPAGGRQIPEPSLRVVARKEDVLGPSAALWTAQLVGAYHWQSYAVIECHGRLFRAAGFAAPELVPLAACLDGYPNDAAGFAAKARILALAHTPGVGRGHWAAGTPPEGAWTQRVDSLWRAARPRTWRADGVWTGADGTMLVHVTTLTTSTVGGIPYQHVFVFGRMGELIGWASNEGDPVR